PTATATATPAAAAPGAPTNVSAVAGKRSADISWQPPASDGGCAINTYIVTSFPDSVITTISGTASSTNVANLTAGAWYTVTVEATNCVSSGPVSVPSNAVRPRH